MRSMPLKNRAVFADGRPAHLTTRASAADDLHDDGQLHGGVLQKQWQKAGQLRGSRRAPQVARSRVHWLDPRAEDALDANSKLGCCCCCQSAPHVLPAAHAA